jgi:hypothetical protein
MGIVIPHHEEVGAYDEVMKAFVLQSSLSWVRSLWNAGNAPVSSECVGVAYGTSGDSSGRSSRPRAVLPSSYLMLFISQLGVLSPKSAIDLPSHMSDSGLQEAEDTMAALRNRLNISDEEHVVRLSRSP